MGVTLQKLNLSKFLYPYQKAYISNKSIYTLFNKSRQIGGSFIVAFKAMLEALNGENHTFISTNNRNAQSLIKTCKKVLKLFEISTSQKFKLALDNRNELEIMGGGVIVSIAANPQTAVGICSNLTIDECSRVPHEEELLDAVLPFISRGNNTFSAVSTPLGQRGIFYDFYQKAKTDPNWRLFEVDIYEAIRQGCPITEEKLQGIKEQFDEVSFRQNYLCEFVGDEDSYFGIDLIKSCIDYNLLNMGFGQVKEIRGTKIAGYDPGKKIDSGVFSVLTRDRVTGIVKVVHLKEFLKVPYTEQINYIVNFCKSTGVSRLAVDATGGTTDCIVELLQKKLGSIVDPLIYTNDVKEQLIVDMKVFMERGNILYPNNEKVISQLQTLQRTVTSSGKTKYSHTPGKHDDYVFSIANALKHFASIVPIRASDCFIGRTTEMDKGYNSSIITSKNTFFSDLYGL